MQRNKLKLLFLFGIVIILTSLSVLSILLYLNNKREERYTQYNTSNEVPSNAYYHDNDYSMIGGVSGLGWVL